MNVLLDLDGTLTDPREGILACIRHALAALERDCPGDAELESCIGPPLQESFALLLGTTDAHQINTAVHHYRERFARTGMFENAVYPGIPSALAALREQGARLFVATSKPLVYSRQIVEHFGLTTFFEGIYGSELDGTRSNKVELIAHILEAELLSPESTFMVGDRKHDVIGALANNVRPVGVLWGYGSRDELRAAGALLLCEEPVELCDLTKPSTSPVI